MNPATPTVHNPENVPQSAVPPGWRIRTQQEALFDPPEGTPFRLWDTQNNKFWDDEAYVPFQDTFEKDWTVLYLEDFHLPEAHTILDQVTMPDSPFVITHTIQASRKVVQLTYVERHQGHHWVIALCDDQTAWEHHPSFGKEWKQLNLPPIPQP